MRELSSLTHFWLSEMEVSHRLLFESTKPEQFQTHRSIMTFCSRQILEQLVFPRNVGQTFLMGSAEEGAGKASYAPADAKKAAAKSGGMFGGGASEESETNTSGPLSLWQHHSWISRFRAFVGGDFCTRELAYSSIALAPLRTEDWDKKMSFGQSRFPEPGPDRRKQGLEVAVRLMCDLFLKWEKDDYHDKLMMGPIRPLRACYPYREDIDRERPVTVESVFGQPDRVRIRRAATATQSLLRCAIFCGMYDGGECNVKNAS